MLEDNKLNVDWQLKSYDIALQEYIKRRDGEFEEQLVQMQLHGFKNLPANANNQELSVETIASRLSMVASVNINGKKFVPVQAVLEGKKVDKAWNVNYLSHGWHRYVGRFPPHVIRALLNGFRISQPCLVLDPFNGSGTTLVESKLMGIDAIGVDICPLSHLISEVKINLDFDPLLLKDALQKVEKECAMAHFKSNLDRWNDIAKSDIVTYSIPDFPNKEKWFSQDALRQLTVLLSSVRKLPEPVAKFFYVAVSSSMRSIANVDVDVVRTEYRKKPRENVNVCGLVSNKIKRFIEDLVTFKKLKIPPSNVEAVLGDARKLAIEGSSVDFIVTSPPYGIEAVSYLRTHMLSYRVLYEVLKTDYKEQGKAMIGSDFVTDVKLVSGELLSPTAKTFFKALQTTKKSDLLRIVQMIQYFQDMEKSFSEISRVLKENCFAVIVIGNKSLLKQKIPTHKIFAEIAENYGLTLRDSLPAKLVCNNPTAVTPWSERTIQSEYLLTFQKC